MGLDACVYCNCFETGKIRKAPKPEWGAHVTKDGSLGTTCKNLDDQMEFDKWLSQEMCEHENGILVHHRIGNSALVGFLRYILKSNEDQFPIILGNVLYGGTHAGDYLDMEKVRALENELTSLSQLHSDDPQDEEFLRVFERQMRDLVHCSLEVGKPICF